MDSKNNSRFMRRLARLPRDIRLRDGGRLRLRELRPRDRDLLKAFFFRCSPESIRWRFFGSIKLLSDGLLNYLSDGDGVRHAALIITERVGDKETIVAEGRYVCFKDRPAGADVALLVADGMRRRGIATLLVQELMEIGRANGVTDFSGDVLSDNREMLSLIKKMFRSLTSKISSGVIHFEIPITR
jgi:GNAT superfamily N-acetyltransferase